MRAVTFSPLPSEQNMAREQWIQDRNESRLHREQELNTANTQRNDIRRDAIDRYADHLVLDYVKAMGELLDKANGSLMSDPIIRIVARLNTLSVLR